jgi:parallel beta-helix repeat protein
LKGALLSCWLDIDRKARRMIKTFNLVLIEVMILSVLISIFHVNTKADLSNLDALESHEPININGTENFTYENGVVSGKGIVLDPYIIENWDIDASIGVGIEIQNSRVHFIIRNCWIHDGGLFIAGIIFSNVTNGIVENSQSSNNQFGILFSSSSNNRVTNSEISNNVQGIYFSNSTKNDISNNNIYSNYWNGIFSFSGSNNIFLKNDINSNSQNGIEFSISSSNNIISENDIDSNGNYGVYLCSESNSNKISNNTVTDNFYGVGFILR